MQTWPGQMTLVSPLSDRFDDTRLRRLLALVGPAMAQGLLDQLATDLAQCQATIAQGARAGDWTALREASHDLISLAGSVGADALHGMAAQLNAAAHDRDLQAVDRLLPDLNPDLAALIALVCATPALPQAPR
jgi:HPt (histidine-containing phosphotransfer) domain-containing protein